MLELLSAGGLPALLAEPRFSSSSKRKWNIGIESTRPAALRRVLLEARAAIAVKSSSAVSTFAVVELVKVAWVSVDLADHVLPSGRKLALGALGVGNVIFIRVVLLFLEAVLVPGAPVLAATGLFFLGIQILLDPLSAEVGARLALMDDPADELVHLNGSWRKEVFVRTELAIVEGLKVTHKHMVLVFVVVVEATVVWTGRTMVVSAGFMSLEDESLQLIHPLSRPDFRLVVLRT
jgi:hypothetical protein